MLSLLARQVLSIERLRPLHDKARTNLDAAALYQGLTLVVVGYIGRHLTNGQTN